MFTTSFGILASVHCVVFWPLAVVYALHATDTVVLPQKMSFLWSNFPVIVSIQRDTCIGYLHLLFACGYVVSIHREKLHVQLAKEDKLYYSVCRENMYRCADIIVQA